MLASRDFVRFCFEYVAEHKAEVRKLIGQTRTGATLALKTKPEPLDKTFDRPRLRRDEKDGKRAHTDENQGLRSFIITAARRPSSPPRRPFAYLFPANVHEGGRGIAAARHHGRGAARGYRSGCDGLPRRKAKSGRPGRTRGTRPDLPSRAADRARRMVRPARSWSAPTQPLGTLAALLLDPRAEDGLTTWNFFDDGLADGKDAPVLALPKSVPLTVGPVRPLPEERTMNKRITVEAVARRRPAGDRIFRQPGFGPDLARRRRALPAGQGQQALQGRGPHRPS